jgi:hypothetical protein
MKRFTDKTVRTGYQWTKITRDNQKRTFTFARGFDGEFQAFEIHTYKFKWIPNWGAAIDEAARMMHDYT